MPLVLVGVVQLSGLGFGLPHCGFSVALRLRLHGLRQIWNFDCGNFASATAHSAGPENLAQVRLSEVRKTHQIMLVLKLLA